MARPKKFKIHLTDAEVKQLKILLKNKNTNDTICRRCRILLGLDENHPPVMTYEQCMANYQVSRGMIANTASIFVNSGIDSVLKLQRNINSDHARRKVDGRTEACLIKIACGPVPDGHSRWTIRLLEKQMKVELEEPISREAIRRTLKKTGLDLTAATTGACQPRGTRNS